MALPQDLRREFAGVSRSYLGMGIRNGIVPNPDPTIRAKGICTGLELYSQVEQDPRVLAAKTSLVQTAVKRPWRVEPASDSDADMVARDLVEAVLKRISTVGEEVRPYALRGVAGVAAHLLEAHFQGYAVAEIMWAEDGNLIYPAEVLARDPRQFVWHRDGDTQSLRLVTAERLGGVEIPPRKVIYHSPTATAVNPYGRGIYSVIWWSLYFKRQIEQFRLIYLDKFGSPTVAIRYPDGSPEAQVEKALDAVEAITQGAGVAVPEGLQIQYLEALRAGAAGYDSAIAYYDDKISEVIMGETGTLNQSGTGGSEARDRVAAEQLTTRAQTAIDDVALTLNRTLVRWIVDVNRAMPGMATAAPPLVYWDFDEAIDIELYSKVDAALHAMGWTLTQEGVMDRYGTGYERRTINLSDPLPNPDPAPVATPQPLEEFAERRTPTGEAPDRITPKLAAAAAGTLDGWVDQVAALARSVSSYEQFSEALPRLFPELDKTALAEVLAPALGLAHLVGVTEVVEEAASE